MWDIIRHKPNGTHLGKAIPTFINNWQQHYSQIKAYDDGAVDVWGFLDLQLFDEKLKTGWVSTAPPNHSRLSIFNLGIATVAKGEWDRSVGKTRDLVWQVVREFDPMLSNVIDMAGSDTRVEGKVRYAKMGLSDDCPFRGDAAGDRLLGKEIPIFERDGNEFLLRHWFIFADSMCRIGFDGELMSFDEVCGRIDVGELTTTAGDARWIVIPSLGRFIPTNGYWGVSAGQRVLEARDIISTLQGGKGAIEKCIEAHRSYDESPTNDNRNTLREAYEAVPDHLKMYCGDMDSKDWPIRRILYPNEIG